MINNVKCRIPGVQLPDHDEAAVEWQAIALQGEAEQDNGRWEHQPPEEVKDWWKDF